MAGKLMEVKFITRSMLRAAPDTLFVFGDNMQRAGLGGQAREMRGEPNAVGIPTKWLPSNNPASYFKDADFDDVKPAIDTAFERLQFHLGPVVWPADGVGTGLAELPIRAPKIFAYIEAGRAALSETTGSGEGVERRYEVACQRLAQGNE